MSNILIQNGRLIDLQNKLDQIDSLYIRDGKISSIGSAPDQFVADTTIDAKGLIVCPGLIDLCARLREPGAEHKATIASETHAAAKAGITLLCMPPDTNPVIDEPAIVELIQKRAQQQQAANIVTLGALTRGLAGHQLSEMAALKKAGCVGISNALQPMESSKVLRHAMEYAATHELTLHVVPMNRTLTQGGVAHEGEVATRLGLQVIPVSAETVAIAQHIALAEETGAKVHFGRITSARAVDMIDRAKQRGVPITADVAIHNLHLTESSIEHFNSQAHVLPPLRASSDRDALRAAFKNGVIDAICSDHQPHEADAKLNPFPVTEPGISGIDTLLSLSLMLVEELDIDIATLLNKLTYIPATILNSNRGSLAVAATADLCLYDPNEAWTVTKERFNSAGKNTPFLNKELKGKVKHTIIDGQLFSA